MGRARGWQLAAAAVVLVVGAGCGLLGDRSGGSADAAPAAAGASATVGGPGDVRGGDARAGRDHRGAHAVEHRATAKAPAPAEDPNHFTEPECATHEGKRISTKAAKSALVAAAATTYWPTSAPRLTVPADLVKAVAWHESVTTTATEHPGGRRLHW